MRCKTYLPLFILAVACICIPAGSQADFVRGSGGSCTNGVIEEHMEDGTLSGCSTGTYYAGYEGTGYITLFGDAGDTITLEFEGTCDETMDMTVRYMCSGTKTATITVNGSTLVTDQSFTGIGVGNNTYWVDIVINDADIIDGTNTVVFTKTDSFNLFMDTMTLDPQ